MWPVAARYFPANDFIFQDDNAPVHRARSIVDYKLKNQIKSVSWPVQSPDLNIIKNIWLRLKRTLQNNVNAIAYKSKLKTAIMDAWINMPQNCVQSLYFTIPRRLRAVVKAN